MHIKIVGADISKWQLHYSKNWFTKPVQLLLEPLNHFIARSPVHFLHPYDLLIGPSNMPQPYEVIICGPNRIIVSSFQKEHFKSLKKPLFIFLSCMIGPNVKNRTSYKLENTKTERSQEFLASLGISIKC